MKNDLNGKVVKNFLEENPGELGVVIDVPRWCDKLQTYVLLIRIVKTNTIVVKDANNIIIVDKVSDIGIKRESIIHSVMHPRIVR
jgi:hypothetical protein